MRTLVKLLLTAWSVAAAAQVPHVVGTWAFNAAASNVPGPPLQSHVRSYRLTDDGVLIGLANIVDGQGRPFFLQFAAKPDGKDYPEFDTMSAARYLIDGTPPRRTYSETPIDSHTVEWVDKDDGRVIASGRKWVSADGQTLSFTQRAKNDRGEDIEYLFVFDRTGP